jgi:hypothetical protein
MHGTNVKKKNGKHIVNIGGVFLLLYVDLQLLLASLAEHLLASEEDFCFTELVTCGCVK